MKKVFSLLLAVLMLVSVLPVAYAAESGGNWRSGTTVVYTAANTEGWTLTVPAKLAPGGSGTVTLEGVWPSNKQLTVTAQDNVVLTNSINAANQKSLDISFVGISELGSDTSSQKFSESISVEPITNALFGKWNGVFYYTVGAQEIDTLGQLQTQYKFDYYSTMNLAVTDVNNGTIGASADVDKENAVAGIYTDENGGVNVVLLQDHTEATRIQPSVDMTINLGGHTLSSDDGVAIDSISGNITVDGRLEGSSIEVIHSDASNARPIQVRTGNFNVNGGTYISNSNGSTDTACIYGMGNITVSNAKIIANNTSGTAKCAEIRTGGTLTISNCELSATSTTGASIGADTWTDATMKLTDCNITTISENTSRSVENEGSATISNCDIRAYANYTYGTEEGEGYYTAISVGVKNYSTGSLTLNNCSVMGTHSGVSTQGTLYVNGGTYEGYGHGGVYFSGDGSGNTAYVRNAIIRQCAMPDGYTATASCNGAGFYIGGNADANNITVNMDNCDIYGSSSQIVLRGSAGEQNNSLYISNSNVYDIDGNNISIRIDNNTHKLYIGAGNNFTAENTTLAEAVVVTDETYTYNG